MLHVRLVVPAAKVESVLDVLDNEPTVANVVAITDVARQPAGDLITCHLARESASRVLARLTVQRIVWARIRMAVRRS
jgi:hypothetical protein